MISVSLVADRIVTHDKTYVINEPVVFKNFHKNYKQGTGTGSKKK